MTYTYDDHHNVLTAKSDEDVLYSFTYDVYGNNISVSIGSGDSKITSSAAYSTDDHNRIVSTTDALGKVTYYNYDASTNVLHWVQYPEDTEATRTVYDYDAMYRTAEAVCTTDTGLNLSAEYTYENGLLSEIQTGSTTYSFGYGDFALRNEVKAGSRTLASYTYTDRDHYLKSLDYGNGDSVEYDYDDKGRLTTEEYENGDTVTYRYDNDGALASVTDSNDSTTTYYYDLTGRVVKYVESGALSYHSVGYEYDDINNLASTVEDINGTEISTTYTYDDDNRIVSKQAGNVQLTYNYDGFGRVASQATAYSGTVVLTENFTYNGNSTQIHTYANTVGNTTTTYTYTYDDNGNIISVSDGTNTTTYAYDSANQLIREKNETVGKVWEWDYDNAGNIIQRWECNLDSQGNEILANDIEYTYNDTQDWGDLLTAYDDRTITYDAIGNPLTDGTWTYTWEHGRQLASMTKGSTTWEYTYNADGLRTKRTNGTTAYSYVYNGGQLTAMTVGSNTLYFSYDASGVPMSVTYGNATYYYVTNIQGDVTGILNSSGALVVSYTYDAWGSQLSCTGSMANDLGTVNPLRYRGYVYDSETELYYLQSRYYDPEMGRFINADGFTSTGQGILGNNMFAYCGNNPICNTDSAGTAHAKSADLPYPIPFGGSAPGHGGCSYGGKAAAVATGTATVIGISIFTAEDQRQEQLAIRRSQAVAITTRTSKMGGAVYIGIDLRGNVWKEVTPPMTSDQAKVWVLLVVATGTFGKGTKWGLYTTEKSDAKAMAWDLGFGFEPMPHPGRTGEYPHYHVAGHNLFGVYKAFHVWYGSINGG